MSKNTREANFRKVDVDELDEEQYRDDAEEVETGDQSDQIGQREAEVKKLTSKYPLITNYTICWECHTSQVDSLLEFVESHFPNPSLLKVHNL